MKLELRHRFPVPPDRAWDELFGEAYEDAVAAQSDLQRELLADDVSDGRGVRRIHVTPARRLPAPVAKLLGTDRFSYVLEERHDRPAQRMDFTVTTDGMADRVKIQGQWRLVPTAGGCERVVTIDIDVKIPVVGGRIEKGIAADLQASYEEAARFAQQWLQERA